MYEMLTEGYDHELKLWMGIVPDFKQEVARRSDYPDSKFLTDNGDVRIDQRFDRTYVYAPESASWCIELTENGHKYVTVTPYTRSIGCELYNAEFNEALNKLLMTLRQKYFESLKTERRVYYYDAATNRLKVAPYGWYDDEGKYKYSMERETNSSIDKKYSIPENNCLIIGTITKTIGNKNGKLHDFIRPEYIINAKDESYQTEIVALLRFSIRSKYIEDMLYENIKRYMEKIGANEAVNVSPEEAAKWFCKKIDDGFKSGDIYKLRDLCYNLYGAEIY